MEKKIDTALCTTALFGVIVFFLWIAVPVVRSGLSHADDAFFAILAKNVATGKGYGYQKSSNEFRLLDPYVNSTGPALVLPIALLIKIFGPLDQLPGAAALVIFILQLIVAAIVIWRRFGWTPTFGFFFAILLLLVLASSNNWYFGSFFGETVAFGFVLIGMALLALARGDRAVVAAALCFSLSVSTKQISLFAVAGIVMAWLIVSIYERKDRTPIFRQLVILILVGSSLPILFEVWKVFALGVAGYKQMFKANWDITAIHAIGNGGRGTRLTTFITTLRTYLPWQLIIGLALLSALLLAFSKRTRNRGDEYVGRFALFAWAGAAVYLAYILLVSTLWSRYFWVGIGVILTAISIPILTVPSKVRVLINIMVVLVVVGFGLYRQPLPVREWNRSVPAERATVMNLLNENPDVPYAAQTGSSLNDILYLRGNQGTWACEPDLGKNLGNRDFIALVNDIFTDKRLKFFKTVVSTCKPLIEQSRISAYRCGDQFWAKYLLRQDSSPSTTDSSGRRQVPHYGFVDRRDCEAIGGWVMSPADPGAEIKVSLYIDDQLVETQSANTLRPDLVGRVGTGRYGFTFKLPSVYRDSKTHTGMVKVADSDYFVPFLENVYSGFECQP